MPDIENVSGFDAQMFDYDIGVSLASQHGGIPCVVPAYGPVMPAVHTSSKHPRQS